MLKTRFADGRTEEYTLGLLTLLVEDPEVAEIAIEDEVIFRREVIA